MLPTIPKERAEKRKFLLDAVESVRNVLMANADEAENIRTLPKVSVDALYDAGLFALKLPEELGGAEADPELQLEIIEAVTRIDTSAGWTLMIGEASAALPAAYLPEEAFRQVYNGERIPLFASTGVPTIKSVPQDGGYVLNGSAPFASGIMHSEWIWVGSLVPQGEDVPPEFRFMVFPTSKAEIIDTWHVAGLKGTGSCDISVKDLFVPHGFTWAVLTDPPKRGGPIYQVPPPGFVTVEHVAFATGVAYRAIDEISEASHTKRRGVPPSPLAERQSFQKALGQAELKISAARAVACDAHMKAYRAAERNEEISPALQARMRASATYVTDVSLEVVGMAFRYAGGSALYNSGVLQRCMRDIAAAAQHFMVSDSAYENHGQALLGLPNVNPMA